MNRVATIAIGGILLLGGIILYVGIHMATVLHMPEVSGWQTPPSRYRNALMDSGGYWMFGLAIVLIGFGGLVLVAALFNRLGRKWRSDLNDIRRRDREFEAERAKYDSGGER